MHPVIAKLLGLSQAKAPAKAAPQPARQVVRKGRRQLVVERQKEGVLLTDVSTGHQIFLRRDGVLEVLFPRTVCDPHSFRVLKIPSKKVKGKHTVHLFCCVRGHWDPEKKRCDRGFFLPHTIFHPPELMPEKLDDFLDGTLTRKRKRIWEALREA